MKAKKLYIVGPSPTQYRHLSVDTDKKIIYFCDYKSYEEGIYCYYTKRDPVNPNVNEWTELPLYLSNIVGFSPSKGSKQCDQIG